MNKYSPRSAQRLSTCDNRIQRVFTKVLLIIDHSVICGFRNEVDQTLAYNSNNSKVQWPNGKHNTDPSKAIDIAPYPTMWDNVYYFYYLAGVVETVAREEGVTMRWGGDWDRDKDFTDQKFMDLGHWEIVD